MNNQDYFVPSEIARLILGYLKEQKLHKTFNTFLRECPDLAEYWQLLRMGRTPATTILGHSLKEILNEFAKNKLNAFASKSMPLENSVFILQTNSTARTLPTKEDVQACLAAEERDRLKKEKQKAIDQKRIWSKTSSDCRRKRQQPGKITSITTSNLLHNQVNNKPLDARIIFRSPVAPSPSIGDNDFNIQPTDNYPKRLQDTDNKGLVDCRRASSPLVADISLSKLGTSGRRSSIENSWSEKCLATSKSNVNSSEISTRLEVYTDNKSTVSCCATGATYPNRSITPESCCESGMRKSEEFDFLDKLLQDTQFHEKLAENINRAILNQSESTGTFKSDDLVIIEDNGGDGNHLNANEPPNKSTLSKEIDVSQVIEMTESDPQIFQNFLKLFQHVPAIPISHLDVPVLNLTDHFNKDPHEKPSSKNQDLLEAQTITFECSAPAQSAEVDPHSENNYSTSVKCVEPNGLTTSMTPTDLGNVTMKSDHSVQSSTIINTSESSPLTNFPLNLASKTLNLRHCQLIENSNRFLDIEVRESPSHPESYVHTKQEPSAVNESSLNPHVDTTSSPTTASYLPSTEQNRSPVVAIDDAPLANCITENIPIPPADSEPCHIFPDENSLTVFSLIEKNAAEMIGEKFVHRSERSENSFEPKETLQSEAENQFQNKLLKDNASCNDAGDDKFKLHNNELSVVDGNHGVAPNLVEGSDTQITVKPCTPASAFHFEESDTFEHGISYPDKVLVKPVCLLNRNFAAFHPSLTNRLASSHTHEERNKGVEPAVELENWNRESQEHAQVWKRFDNVPYNTRAVTSTSIMLKNEQLGIRAVGSTPPKEKVDISNDDLAFSNQMKGYLSPNKNGWHCDEKDKIAENKSKDKPCESDSDSIIVIDDSLTESSIFFNKNSRNSSHSASPGYCGGVHQEADSNFNVSNKFSLCSTQEKHNEINGSKNHIKDKDSCSKMSLSTEESSLNSAFTQTFYRQCNTLSSPPYSAMLHSDTNSPRKLTSGLPANPGSSSLPASLSDRKPVHLKSPRKGNSLLRQVSPKKRVQTTKTVISVHSHHSPFIPAHCKKAPSRRITPRVVCQSTPSPLQDFPSSPMTVTIDLQQSSQPSTPSAPLKDEDCSNPSIPNKMALPNSLSVKSPIIEPVSTKSIIDPNAEQSSGKRYLSINVSQVESMGICLPPSPSQRKPRRIKTTLLSSEVKKGWSSFVRSVSPLKPDRASPLLDDAKFVSSSSDLLSASQSEVEAFRLLSVLTSSYTKPQPRQDITSTDQAQKPSKCGCVPRDTCRHHKGKLRQKTLEKSFSEAVSELGEANSDLSSYTPGIEEHKIYDNTSTTVSANREDKSDMSSKVNNVSSTNSNSKCCEQNIESAQGPFLNDTKFGDDHVQSPFCFDNDKSFRPIGILEFNPKKSTEFTKVLEVPTKCITTSGSQQNPQNQPIFSNAATETLKTIQCRQIEQSTEMPIKSQMPTDNIMTKTGQNELKFYHDKTGLVNQIFPINCPLHPTSEDGLRSLKLSEGCGVQINSSNVTCVLSSGDVTEGDILTSSASFFASSSAGTFQNPSENCVMTSDLKTNNSSSQSVNFSTYTDLVAAPSRSADSCHVSFTALLTAPISVANVGLSDSIFGALRVANNLEVEIDSLQSQQHTIGRPCKGREHVNRLEMMNGQEIIHQTGSSAHSDRLHQNHPSYTNDECSLLRQAMLECEIPIEISQGPGSGDRGKARLIKPLGQTSVLGAPTVPSQNPSNKPNVTDNTPSNSCNPISNSNTPQRRKKSRKLSDPKSHTVRKQAKILPLLSTPSPLLDKLSHLNQAFNYRKILPALPPTMPYACSGIPAGKISVVHTETGSIITIPPDYCDIVNNLLAEKRVHSPLSNLVEKPSPLTLPPPLFKAAPVAYISLNSQTVAPATQVKVVDKAECLANEGPRAKPQVFSKSSKFKTLSGADECPSGNKDLQRPEKITDITVSNTNSNSHVKMVSKIADRLRSKFKKVHNLESAVSKQNNESPNLPQVLNKISKDESVMNTAKDIRIIKNPKVKFEKPITVGVNGSDSIQAVATVNNHFNHDEMPRTAITDRSCEIKDVAKKKQNVIPQHVGNEQEMHASILVEALPQKNLHSNIRGDFSSNVQNFNQIIESNKHSHSQEPTYRKRKISEPEVLVDKRRKIDSETKVNRLGESIKNIFEEMEYKSPGNKHMKLPTGCELKGMKDPGVTSKQSLLYDPKSKYGGDSVCKRGTKKFHLKTLKEEKINVITQDKNQTSKYLLEKSLKLSPNKLESTGKPENYFGNNGKKSIGKKINTKSEKVYPMTKQETSRVLSAVVRCANEGDEIVNTCPDYEVCTPEKASPSSRHVGKVPNIPQGNMSLNKLVPPERMPVSKDKEFTPSSEFENINLSAESGPVIDKSNVDKYIDILKLSQSFLNLKKKSPPIGEVSDVPLVNKPQGCVSSMQNNIGKEISNKPHAKNCSLRKDERCNKQAQKSKDTLQTPTKEQLENCDLCNTSSLGLCSNEEIENAVKALELSMAETGKLIQDTSKNTTLKSAKSDVPRTFHGHSEFPQHGVMIQQDSAKVSQVNSSPLKRHLPPKKRLSFEVFPNPTCSTGQELDSDSIVEINTEVAVSTSSDNGAACISVLHPTSSSTPAQCISKTQVSSSAVENVESIKKTSDCQGPATYCKVSQPFEKSSNGIPDVSRVMTPVSRPGVTGVTKSTSFSNFDKLSGEVTSDCNSSTSYTDSQSPICLSKKSKIDKLLKKLHRKKDT